ncbi:MAG: hypothetical protein PHH73_00245 [Candidatus Rickettsiella isopodorum]|nr:hypothetical protein [Candidatus Rickettsiella isopodorum]
MNKNFMYKDVVLVSEIKIRLSDKRYAILPKGLKGNISEGAYAGGIIDYSKGLPFCWDNSEKQVKDFADCFSCTIEIPHKYFKKGIIKENNQCEK